MNKLSFITGDICDIPADVIVTTANNLLNMSGGVNGEILMRGGEDVQKELYRYKESKSLKVVPEGTVVKTSAGPLTCKYLLHAVAVNGAYESSKELVVKLVSSIMQMLQDDSDVSSVAIPALGTGYGNLTIADFSEGIKSIDFDVYDSISEVKIVFYNQEGLDEALGV